MADARLTADTAIDKPPRRRRWVPLSLKMFVAMVVLAGSGSLLMFGAPIYRLYRQQIAIRTIDRLGGKIDSKPRGPQRLRAILGNKWMKPFDKVVDVDLSNTEACDSDLANISALQTVHLLDLSHTKVTDKGLQQVAKLPNLSLLNLEGTPVTDKGLQQIFRLKHLWLLTTYGTRVTEPAIENLEEHLPDIYVARQSCKPFDWFCDPRKWIQRQQEREAREARRLARQQQ